MPGITLRFPCDGRAPYATHGTVKYGAAFSLPEANAVVKELLAMCEFFAAALLDWHEAVEKERRQQPLLNRFTTRQLLLLE